MLKKSLLFVLMWLMFISIGNGEGEGEVIIILCSDTATWDGMSVATFTDHYGSDVFTSPSFNGYKVMDAAWRNKLIDSYGNTVRFTWFMMAGNIYRYADNINMPYANTMCMYFMKKYHAEAIKQFGDELTLHYHTFNWTDYDGDGVYYWNQAHTFNECRSDFDYTLCQYLLEENNFPVSFRSGWHYMDNDWQNYLDELLPYSLDDSYPDKRYVTNEPIDNVFDWSQSSPYYLPFHPSTANYQHPGNCKGWNLRCTAFGGVSESVVDKIFSEANKGKTQVACFWGHLPDDLFMPEVEKIDSLTHLIQKKYPNVKFRYCSAIDGMQKFQKSNDKQAPQIEFTDIKNGDQVSFQIKTDEPIFQKQPFVAVKNVYEQFTVAQCKKTGVNTWQTVDFFPLKSIAKAGVALTDTVGNQSKAFIKYLPDDVFSDESDSTFKEIRGSWSVLDGNNYWNLKLKQASVPAGDSATAEWFPAIENSGNYNVFFQTQAASNPIDKYTFTFFNNGMPVDTIYIDSLIPAKKWFRVCTKELAPGLAVKVTYKNKSLAAETAFADAIKISPLIRDKQIVFADVIANLGTYCEFDTASKYSLKLFNNGSQALTVSNITSKSGNIKFSQNYPVTISANGSIQVPLMPVKLEIGKYTDTLFVNSDDPVNPVLQIPCIFEFSPYYEMVDNENTLQYSESGTWFFSNAAISGTTSRYSPLANGKGSYAVFSAKVRKTGTYNFFEIVPKTQNADTSAYYEIKVNGTVSGSTILNQNENSGTWVQIGKAYATTGSKVEVKVLNNGAGGAEAGFVLRADAVKMVFADALNNVTDSKTAPVQFMLEQNYPNPFNASTRIRFQLSSANYTTLAVYDILGRRVVTLIDGNLNAGNYQVNFEAGRFSSGMYILRLQSGSYNSLKKIMLLK